MTYKATSIFTILSLIILLVCYAIFGDLSKGVVYSYLTPTVNYLKDVEIAHDHSGLTGLDAIYVINSKDSKEWQRLQQSLVERGLKANPVEVIDESNLTYDKQAAVAGFYPLRLKSRQLANLLSHLSIIRDAYERNYQLVWIMEDRVDLLEPGSEYVLLDHIAKLNTIDSNWDIFYTDPIGRNYFGMPIYSDFINRHFRRPEHSILKLFWHLNSPLMVHHDIHAVPERWGSYSYFLSRNGMKKILDYFLFSYVWNMFDIEINYIQHLRKYAPNTDIVTVWYEKD